MAATNIITHSEPAWRQDADVILKTPLEGGRDLPEWEQLWGRVTSGRRAVLCCIPFGAYNLHLGDEVEFDESYVIIKVIHRSNHFTFRVWFGGVPEEARHEIIEEVSSAGVLVERGSDDHVGLSVQGLQEAERISGLLAYVQRQGLLVYETGTQ